MTRGATGMACITSLQFDVFLPPQRPASLNSSLRDSSSYRPKPGVQILMLLTAGQSAGYVQG